MNSPSKKFWVMFFFGGAIVTLGMIGFISRIWNKVTTGHGADYYKTFWGVEFSYTGALVLMLLFPIILLIPLVYHYLEHREEKDFLRKYGKK